MQQSKEPTTIKGVRAIYRIILIVLTAACAVGACITAPLALMTAVMAFDAPGSEQKVWVWIASFAILSIPLWFVVGAVLGWVLHLRGWLRCSLVAAAVPLVALCVGWALLID
jgi:hypothetical protein